MQLNGRLQRLEAVTPARPVYQIRYVESLEESDALETAALASGRLPALPGEIRYIIEIRARNYLQEFS